MILKNSFFRANVFNQHGYTMADIQLIIPELSRYNTGYCLSFQQTPGKSSWYGKRLNLQHVVLDNQKDLKFLNSVYKELVKLGILDTSYDEVNTPDQVIVRLIESGIKECIYLAGHWCVKTDLSEYHSIFKISIPNHENWSSVIAKDIMEADELACKKFPDIEGIEVHFMNKITEETNFDLLPVKF